MLIKKLSNVCSSIWQKKKSKIRSWLSFDMSLIALSGHPSSSLPPDRIMQTNLELLLIILSWSKICWWCNFSSFNVKINLNWHFSNRKREHFLSLFNYDLKGTTFSQPTTIDRSIYVSQAYPFQSQRKKSHSLSNERYWLSNKYGSLSSMWCKLKIVIEEFIHAYHIFFFLIIHERDKWFAFKNTSWSIKILLLLSRRVREDLN